MATCGLTSGQITLPTRVTYTREIEFDASGAVWTSNSNLPAWQIEGATPKIIRLEPDGETRSPLTVAAKE